VGEKQNVGMVKNESEKRYEGESKMLVLFQG
jgi:hypothetical protein